VSVPLSKTAPVYRASKFYNINISHNVVMTHLEYAGIFNNCFIANLLLSERVLKIGEYLMKL